MWLEGRRREGAGETQAELRGRTQSRRASERREAGKDVIAED